jgi:hypothetical protein
MLFPTLLCEGCYALVDWVVVGREGQQLHSYLGDLY